jgi:peptide/nickel transport system substrate-binding protein
MPRTMRAVLAQNTAGSGPFMLKSWQKGQQLVLVPNPHWPGQNRTLSASR